MYNKITIVDENDNVIGYEADLHYAIEQKMIRRISRVFVFDTHGRLLIQKRSQNVNHPGKYDQSVGGHVDEGETYETSAIREMEEELGLTGLPLTEVVMSYPSLDLQLFNAIYKVTISEDTKVVFDTHEVESIHWMTPAEVDDLAINHKEDCQSSFAEIWLDLRDKLLA